MVHDVRLPKLTLSSDLTVSAQRTIHIPFEDSSTICSVRVRWPAKKESARRYDLTAREAEKHQGEGGSSSSLESSCNSCQFPLSPPPTL